MEKSVYVTRKFVHHCGGSQNPRHSAHTKEKAIEGGWAQGMAVYRNGMSYRLLRLVFFTYKCEVKSITNKLTYYSMAG